MDNEDIKDRSGLHGSSDLEGWKDYHLNPNLEKDCFKNGSSDMEVSVQI